MRMRVSRDGGKTWGPTQHIEESPPGPDTLPDSWFQPRPEMPPCECPRCRVRPVRLDLPLSRVEVLAYCSSLSALVLALLIGISSGR
ncbi:hypothetical protein KDA82_07700 [Streptomyces daliensis]|uniref:Uncharacterized protein n=1 Tax=Streptomyces daliensis TaxID=299421 RepID=A0A8T4INA8_9ACTN|nr:hypothetical protein [Streptomyces daliensis]